MFLYFSIIFFIFSFIVIKLCSKYNILIDDKSEKHKKFSTQKKTNLLGGFLLIIFFCYYLLDNSLNYPFVIFLAIIFLVGILSDIKKINSASLRFLLQLILVIFFVYFLNIEIKYSKIDLFDKFLKNQIFSVLFSTFCLLILINGSNFIDGINGLVIKYYLLIYILIFWNLNYFSFDLELLLYLIIALIVVLIFNLSGYIFLGDSGSYLISLFTGIFLINFSADNAAITPYLIIVLLWYPCFELLFSMIRRFLKKTKTYKPDTQHLHQLVYKFVKKKIYIKNDLVIHLITSSSINAYNLVSFVVALNYIYNSFIMLTILTINITSYLILYKLLRK